MCFSEAYNVVSCSLYAAEDPFDKYILYLFYCVCVCVCMLLTATFVGGGFIVGLTEAVYSPTMGLTWAVIPVTAVVSFIVGKTIFQFFIHHSIECLVFSSFSDIALRPT